MATKTTRTMRGSIMRGIVVLILLTSAAILGVSYIGTQKQIRTVTASLTRQTLEATEVQLASFFSPVTRGIQMSRRWADSGFISLDDPESLIRLYQPYLKQFPQVSSIQIADNRGREFMLYRDGSDWRVRITDVESWGARKEIIEWNDDSSEFNRSALDSDYDPRTRPWFKDAMGIAVASQNASVENTIEQNRSTITWTEPYEFFTAQRKGITAASSVSIGTPENASEEQATIVVAFDVLLSSISEYTTKIRIGGKGMAFVTTQPTEESAEVQTVGLPYDARFTDRQVFEQDILKRPSELGIPVVNDASDAWANALASAGIDPLQDIQAALEFGPFRFESENGVMWWGEIRHHPADDTPNFLMAVLVPESIMLGNINRFRFFVVLITITAIALALFMAANLARKLSAPIESLVSEANRIREGDFEAPNQAVASTVAEVYALSSAVDRMRTGLRSLFKIEKELQVAKQIQESTFPQVLPEMAGLDIEAWTEPADETGGDTYDVVGIQPNTEVQNGSQDSFLFTNEDCSRIFFLLADATGHGIGPALCATQVRSMLRMALRLGANSNQIVSAMNRQLCQDLPAGRFSTAWFGAITASTFELESFSAGQGPLLFLRAGEHEADCLDADTWPLGLDAIDLESSPPQSFMMQPGDIFAVFSDGFFETSNDEGELFGNVRVVDVIRDYRTQPAKVMLQALRDAVVAFSGGKPADDDRTAIIIIRK